MLINQNIDLKYRSYSSANSATTVITVRAIPQVNGEWRYSSIWDSETLEPTELKFGTFDYIIYTHVYIQKRYISPICRARRRIIIKFGFDIQLPYIITRVKFYINVLRDFDFAWVKFHYSLLIKPACDKINLPRLLMENT